MKKISKKLVKVRTHTHTLAGAHTRHTHAGAHTRAHTRHRSRPSHAHVRNGTQWHAHLGRRGLHAIAAHSPGRPRTPHTPHVGLQLKAALRNVLEERNVLQMVRPPRPPPALGLIPGG